MRVCPLIGDQVCACVHCPLIAKAVPLHGFRHGGCPKNILNFSITPMGVAWKELTSKGFCQLPQPTERRRALVPQHVDVRRYYICQ